MDMMSSVVTIAVVDDDESVLDAVKTVLEGEDWDTQTYASGEDFLSDLKNHKPDCIILDANLKGVSGVAVALTVGSSYANSIPVIILTAYPGSPQTTKIKNIAACDVLVKPVTAEVLIQHIQEALKPK